MKEDTTHNLLWTDVHTHLNMLDIPADKALKSAHLAGVDKVITIGTEPSDWGKVTHFCQQFPDQVRGALGLHPHLAKLYNKEVKAQLEQGLKCPGMVAVGEIGLDYYYEHSDKETQKEVFKNQLEIAVENTLPVEIHTRSAEQDTIDILTAFKGKVQGLLHCFTGPWSLARKALDIGFDISFSGIVTFKKTHELRDVCQKVPLNRLHLETDAPYLAPMPHRGKKNQPALLPHTAQVVADLHKVSLKELSQQTRANDIRLFSSI